MLIALLIGSGGAAQSPATRQAGQTPDFSIQIWGDVVADFNARMKNYADLRGTLEQGLPRLALTDDPVDIRTAEVALALRIRAARRGVGQGAIFTPAISSEFRKVLRLEAERNAYIRAVILDDNPGRFAHCITGTYPKDKAYSTVPGNILALLPGLPDDVYYRFLSSDLVLHDTRANVILDRVPCAIPCSSR